MNKIIRWIIYYILAFWGLIFVSWMIWSRFIRTRTIREIPDYFLTEYRFWILIYICCIYIYVIKNLIKPTNTESIFSILSENINKPLIILDRSIKYNAFIKPYFHKNVLFILNNLKKIEDHHVFWFIMFMRIIPRIILVMFLCLDTFYFQKLEIFYKIVLIGLLPFIFRYFKHSIKDVYNYWVEELEEKYKFVVIFEEGHESDFSHKKETKAIHHYTNVSVKEFIKIKYENHIQYILDYVDYKYVGRPYAKEHVYKQYAELNNKKTTLKSVDYENIRKKFNELMPKLLKVLIFLDRIKSTEDLLIIKGSKIIIYLLYLICWGYILITSYYHYPIELIMFKYLINNFMDYLCNVDDPFSMSKEYSMNKNLITKKSITYLIKNIISFIHEKFPK